MHILLRVVKYEYGSPGRSNIKLSCAAESAQHQRYRESKLIIPDGIQGVSFNDLLGFISSISCYAK